MIKPIMHVLRMLYMCLLLDVVDGDCGIESALLNTKLNVSAIATISKIEPHSACVLACIENPLCQSTNYNSAETICEHLNVTKWTRQEKLVEQMNWTHLSNTAHDCWKVPCKNQEMCVSKNGIGQCVCPKHIPISNSCDSPQKDCASWKSLHPEAADGDYLIAPTMFPNNSFKVYCMNMSGTPVEYIHLNSSTNVAHIDSRMISGHPPPCPTTGPFKNFHWSNAGHTTFSKVRLDPQKMAIVRDDHTFSTSTGKRIFYGTGGDCYAVSECHLGYFKVDLSGTCLKLKASVTWNGFGYLPGKRIVMNFQANSQRTVFSASCGGHCAHCDPTEMFLEPIPDCQ